MAFWAVIYLFTLSLHMVPGLRLCCFINRIDTKGFRVRRIPSAGGWVLPEATTTTMWTSRSCLQVKGQERLLSDLRLV